MKYLLLGAPLALAACGTPCPVPRECITPEWCVCLVTGAVDPLPDGDGSAAYLAAMPEPTTPPDQNGGPTADDHGPGNGGGTKDDTSDGNGGSSDDNGDWS